MSEHPRRSILHFLTQLLNEREAKKLVDFDSVELAELPLGAEILFALEPDAQVAYILAETMGKIECDEKGNCTEDPHPNFVLIDLNFERFLWTEIYKIKKSVKWAGVYDGYLVATTPNPKHAQYFSSEQDGGFDEHELTLRLWQTPEGPPH